MKKFTKIFGAAVALSVAAFSAQAQCADDLIFSQYAEGSGFNKCIEIYNGTGTTVDLSDYEYRAYHNGRALGAGPSFAVCLSGDLADGGTLVICNPSQSLGIPADAETGSISHNGDDALALYKKSAGDNVDVIGVIGVDPGSAWTSSGKSTQDQTLTRDAAVLSGYSGLGDANFLDSWNSDGFESTTGWGSHAINTNCAAAPAAPFAITYCPEELFFSEYVEGSGFNKCIEIYNGSNHEIDLSCYQYNAYHNGALSPTFQINLSGTIAAGDVYVICNSGSSFAGAADLVTNDINHNGDDALVLNNVCEGTIADIFGVVGDDPGSYWSALGFNTQDVTIRRNADILGGVTSNPSIAPGSTDNCAFCTLGNWTAYPINDISGLGAHSTVDCGYSCGNGKGGDKVEICHKGKTICVSVNAVEAHFGEHGDTYQCQNAKADFFASDEAITNLTAFPNPFASKVTMNFNVAEEAVLNVYTVTGEVVYTQNVAAGQHSIQWDANGMASGMYIARISTSNETSNIKLMLAK